MVGQLATNEVSEDDDAGFGAAGMVAAIVLVGAVAAADGAAGGVAAGDIMVVGVLLADVVA